MDPGFSGLHCAAQLMCGQQIILIGTLIALYSLTLLLPIWPDGMSIYDNLVGPGVQPLHE